MVGAGCAPLHWLKVVDRPTQEGALFCDDLANVLEQVMDLEEAGWRGGEHGLVDQH